MKPEEIVRLIKSPVESDRKKAVLALVEIKDLRALSLLKQIASRDDSVQIRYLAKKGILILRKKLETTQEKKSSDSLEQPRKQLTFSEMLESKDSKIREKALEECVGKNSPDLCDLLLKALKIEDDGFLRSRMISLLGTCISKDELKEIRFFLSDSDPRVRANVLDVIGMFAEEKDFPKLLELLEDNDNRVVANALSCLEQFGYGKTLQKIEEMLCSGKVWEEDSAIYALIHLKKSSSYSLLVKTLKHKRRGIRQKALHGIKILALAEDANAKKFLIERGISPEITENPFDVNEDLNEEILKDASVQNVAEKNVEIENISPEITEEPFGEEETGNLEKQKLEEKLKDDNYEIRLQAVTEIMEEGYDDMRDTLLSRLNHETDNYVISSILTCLGKILPQNESAKLLGFLNHDNGRLRASAVTALSAFMDVPEVKRALEKMLEDQNNRVRANAVMALKDDQPLKVKKVLSDMLLSGEELMIRSALYAISDIGTKDAYSLISDNLQTDNKEVGEKALEVLQIGYEMGMESCKTFLDKFQSRHSSLKQEEIHFEEDLPTPETEKPKETNEVGEPPQEKKTEESLDITSVEPQESKEQLFLTELRSKDESRIVKALSGCKNLNYDLVRDELDELILHHDMVIRVLTKKVIKKFRPIDSNSSQKDKIPGKTAGSAVKYSLSDRFMEIFPIIATFFIVAGVIGIGYVWYTYHHKNPEITSPRDQWTLVGTDQKQFEIKDEKRRIQKNLIRTTILNRRTQLQSAHQQCLDLFSQGKVRSAMNQYKNLQKHHKSVAGALRTLEKFEEDFE